MRRLLPALALPSSAGVVLCSEPALTASQQISQPLRGFGASITAAYEGWFNSADGTHNFLIGYYNRNEKMAADIPIGGMPLDPEYPAHYEVRYVSRNGGVRWHNHWVNVSHVLAE